MSTHNFVFILLYSMQALGSHLHALLHDAITERSPGLFTVTRDGIARIWAVTQARGKAADWKRCSDFLNSTGQKFLRGDGGSEHAEPEYNANIFVLMLFDLGFSVSVQEWNAFLASHPARLKSQEDQGLQLVPISGGSEVDCQSPSSLVANEPEISDQLIGRRKRKRMTEAVYDRLGAGQDGQEIATDDVDIDHLCTILKARDATISRLRSEKKLLQQSLRRLQQRLSDKDSAHKAEVQVLTDRKDFDLERRNPNWEGNRNWSWLTPTGQINAAATRSIVV